MSEKSRRKHVLEKYRLTEHTMVEATSLGSPLGSGPIMCQAAFDEFVRRDPSGNDKYLDWMLFIAGGGQTVMERTLSLWKGSSPTDPESLRNQTKADFVNEWMAGFYDETEGVKHEPVTRAVAEAKWADYEPRSFFEFVMGDEDIAVNDGFGFYRYWPGKDGLYEKITAAIGLWHKALPKLKAYNSVNKDVPGYKPVELDLYKGWSPNDYSQQKACYNTLAKLQSALSLVRVAQVLNDVRHDVIYTDDRLTALCPLTVGASIKFGHQKWCTANRTDFERSFQAEYPARSHWYTYCSAGPLVYITFKSKVPVKVAKVALHLKSGDLKTFSPPWPVPFFDTENNPPSTSYGQVLAQLGWADAQALEKALFAIAAWGKRFDCSRLVLNYDIAEEVSST